jgi:hypothetical protein
MVIIRRYRWQMCGERLGHGVAGRYLSAIRVLSSHRHRTLAQQAYTRGSAQLAVFAGAPVNAAAFTLLFFQLGLALYAQAHARHCDPPGLRYVPAAFFTMSQAIALTQPASGFVNRIFNAGVDLILHGAIPCPSSGHNPRSFGSYVVTTIAWLLLY